MKNVHMCIFNTYRYATYLNTIFDISSWAEYISATKGGEINGPKEEKEERVILEVTNMLEWDQDDWEKDDDDWDDD